jgi:lysophospholipase L1-like esterase
MKRCGFFIVLFGYFFIAGCSLDYKYRAHQYHFEKDIQALEKLTEYKELEDYLLFIGSSSIRRWNTIQEDMWPYAVVKRGYGGAHYYDLIHYIDRLIEDKQEAKAVIIFVANDITGSNGWDKLHNDLTPKEVKVLFKAITKKIHKKQSNKTPIYVIETTPTPSRRAVWDKISKANDLIQNYTKQDPNLHFISTRNYFLNQKGLPVGKYFVADSLHLSEAGYNLWERIIKEKLKQH